MRQTDEVTPSTRRRLWSHLRPATWLPGDQARRLVTLATVFAAAFASVATSPAPESVRGQSQGPRVELSVEEPEVTVAVDIIPSAEADSALEKRVGVFVQPVLSEFPARVEGNPTTSTLLDVGEVLELSAIDEAGEVLAKRLGSRLVCDVEGCVGMAAIRFRLVDQSVDRVVLNWNLGADFYFGAGEVPGGAEIVVEIGESDTDVTAVVAQGAMSSTFSGTRYLFSVDRLQIHAPHGVASDAELSFEPLHAGQGDLLIGPDEVYRLSEQMAVRLQPPTLCLTGSCDWSLLLKGTQTQWQLAADPDLDIDAGVASVSPVELESSTVSGDLELKPGEESRLSFLVEVDRSFVTGPDFDYWGPLASIELRLAWEDPDLSLRAPGFRFWDNALGLEVLYRPVQLECDEQTCRAEAQTQVSFSSEEASGTVTWEARAFVPYLISGRVPEGGEIRLEVQQ